MSIGIGKDISTDIDIETDIDTYTNTAIAMPKVRALGTCIWTSTHGLSSYVNPHKNVQLYVSIYIYIYQHAQVFGTFSLIPTVATA